ncbi:hypothetical protein QBC32DRAFT_355304 [Pseudoneurospora amorphoporcata]|uniref:Uncharacterized protein n=1 Tax=Pseudoneurospora amorphoporcata TaxID=241081 RepID=A0AAN6NLR1_9PEZI|nr:hypothetical protein QBC32DRAFT_355304 [Pseudoneurospora amorphoporcata]
MLLTWHTTMPYLVRSPDAMHWYTFANRTEIWNICNNPVSKREKMKASSRGSVAMPFGPANSAALTSDYQGPLIPRYATAVTELPQDPTDDPHAIMKRLPIYLERLEAWKDEVARTAEHNVDPDEIFPSPPSTYLESPPPSSSCSSDGSAASGISYDQW